MSGKFNIGERVQLKSGGPPMTVERCDRHDLLLCTWFDHARVRHSDLFHETMLQRPGREPKSILLVEDDDDLRQAIAELMLTEGHRVLSAQHGQEALELLKCAAQRPALILLDLMMPVMDGWRFLEALEEDPEVQPAPPIVVMTAASHLKKRPVGDRQVLAKPFEITAVAEAIERYLN